MATNMNYIDTIKEGLWLTMTTYHEARGEPIEGQKAVVKVILNRANIKNRSIKAIVLQPKHFSCYNDGMPQIKQPNTFINLNTVINEAIDEWFNGDTLQGATHYYAIKGMVGNKPPYWAQRMKFIAEIAGHRFLKEV